MSKFRIELTPSKIRRRINFVLCLLFLFSIWSWKSDVFHHQPLIQGLLSLVLVLVFWQKIHEKQQFIVLSVGEDGQWQRLEGNESEPVQFGNWQIQPTSKLTPLWHWVVLNHTISNKVATQIIYKDALSDENWRHLSRIIKQIQSNAISYQDEKR